MTTPTEECLDASMDNTSDHSIKTRLDDGSQVMTSVSPVQLQPTKEPDQQHDQPVPYRLYKKRFVGLLALVPYHSTMRSLAQQLR